MSVCAVQGVLTRRLPLSLQTTAAAAVRCGIHTHTICHAQSSFPRSTSKERNAFRLKQRISNAKGKRAVAERDNQSAAPTATATAEALTAATASASRPPISTKAQPSVKGIKPAPLMSTTVPSRSFHTSGRRSAAIDEKQPESQQQQQQQQPQQLKQQKEQQSQQVTRIPGERLRSHRQAQQSSRRTGSAARLRPAASKATATTSDQRPSDFLNQLFLCVHPDLFASNSGTETYTIVGSVDSNGNNSSNSSDRIVSVDVIKAGNQHNLALLNSILDYSKQYRENESISSNGSQADSVKPPLRLGIQFYSRVNSKTAMRMAADEDADADTVTDAAASVDHNCVQIIRAVYTPPVMKATAASRSSNTPPDTPPLLINDRIEQLILQLIKHADISVDNDLFDFWSQRWQANRTAHDAAAAATVVDTKHSPYGNVFSWQGTTGAARSDAVFLEAFRNHSSSVIPPMDRNNRTAAVSEFDIDGWALTRARHTLVSLMAAEQLLEFDARLESEQRAAAVTTLKTAITKHFTRLQCSLWSGIGICFVADSSTVRRAQQQQHERGDALNSNNGRLQQQQETPWLRDVLRTATVPLPQSAAEAAAAGSDSEVAEWNFTSRPGWWLIPYNFNEKQLLQFVALFMHAVSLNGAVSSITDGVSSSSSSGETNTSVADQLQQLIHTHTTAAAATAINNSNGGSADRDVELEVEPTASSSRNSNSSSNSISNNQQKYPLLERQPRQSYKSNRFLEKPTTEAAAESAYSPLDAFSAHEQQHQQRQKREQIRAAAAHVNAHKKALAQKFNPRTLAKGPFGSVLAGIL